MRARGPIIDMHRQSEADAEGTVLMKKCPYCGQLEDGSSSVCRLCHTPLEAEPASAGGKRRSLALAVARLLRTSGLQWARGAVILIAEPRVGLLFLAAT